jgi:fatty-acyl-CoA synthase
MGATTTWRQLHDRVCGLAGAMARRGIGFGDRVIVLMTNRPEFMETVLAANRLGAIAVPVNFRFSGPEVSYIVENSAPDLLVTDEATEQLAHEVAVRHPSLRHVSTAGTSSGWAEPYDELLTEPGGRAGLVDVPEEAAALIMYTSGTTGRPKGAVLTHQNLQVQALTVVRAFRLWGDGEVNLIAAPMFHIAGVGSIVPTMLIGGTVVILPSGAFDSSRLLDVLENERVTTAFLVPTQWQAVCSDPSVSRRDLAALRVTCWGAAPATDTLLRRMAEVFPDTLNVAVFGQTEMSPITCVLDGDDALRKLGSVGKPVSTVAMRIVDSKLADVRPGEVGEAVYQGPTVMAGYWRDPAATADAFQGGWFHSGDLVRVDEEGFVFVVDRVKDMIISGGENVYCAEVENALAAHPAIAEVSVIGRPHPTWGETPVAVAALRPGATLDIATLRDWAELSLARYKLPTALEIVDALPRNASGKVVKGALRARFRV